MSLPVALCVRPDAEAGLRGHVEGVLGWQVVDDDLLGLVRPVVALADGSGPDAPPGVPVVHLLHPDVGPVDAAAEAAVLGPAAVLAWPDDRARLPSVVEVARAMAVGPADAPVATTLSVAGAAGGVGTTTIALALAGLAAWGGRATLAVCRGDVPVPDVPDVERRALDGPAAWRAAATVDAVPGLRVVRLDPSDGIGPAGGAPTVEVPVGTAVVHDLGTEAAGADVLVARRDRAGRDAIAASAAGALVVVDDGPLAEAELLEAVGGRTVAILPWSARVARAGLHRRVPRSLPGAWLATLDGLVPGFSTGRRIGGPPQGRPA